MATYLHLSICCDKEFELEYSVKLNPPTTCPFCQSEGNVKRLIYGPTAGTVELYGHELKAKLQEDGRKMAKEMRGSESKMANFHGESKINDLVKAKERAIDNLTRIKYSSKK